MDPFLAHGHERQDQLYVGLRASAIQLAKRLVQTDEAEDLAHDSLLSLIEYAHCHRVRSLRATLTAIVRRRACDCHRRHGREQFIADEPLFGAHRRHSDQTTTQPETPAPATVRNLARGRRQRVVLNSVLAGHGLAYAADRLGIPLKEVRRIATTLAQRIAAVGPPLQA